MSQSPNQLPPFNKSYRPSHCRIPSIEISRVRSTPSLGISDITKTLTKYAFTFYKRLAKREITQQTLVIGCTEIQGFCELLCHSHQPLTHQNEGNLVPPSVEDFSDSPSGVLEATIHHAVEILKVKEVIICGHSECSAMKALLSGTHRDPRSSYASWLRLGRSSLKSYLRGSAPDQTLSMHNQLSQVNIIQQIQNLKTYDSIERLLKMERIRLSGWYYDTKKGEILTYSQREDKFMTTRKQSIFKGTQIGFPQFG
jgi:carbonic anhydrase